MPKRSEPLHAHPVPPASTSVPPPPVAAPGDNARFARLAAGAATLKARTSSKLGERTLMIAGGIVAPIGILLVLLGWYGAAHTPYIYEQIPYMISGGLLGLGLVFLGAFFYFTHWVTELVKEHRVQSAAMLEAIARLEATVTKEAGNDRLALAKVAGTNGHGDLDADHAIDPSGWQPERELVATAKGTMAHRPECVVVAGKHGLRAVDDSEGLMPCKLCDPYAATSEAQSLS